jgi:UDP:flavonoid glycosyltransferase YjiC (YdhE family)
VRSILILTSGTRGDVEPYTALARALRELGHEVRIAAHHGHLALVSEAGIPWCALTDNPSEALRVLGVTLGSRPTWHERLRALRRFHRAVFSRYRDLAAAAARLVNPGDTVILGLPTIWLYRVARARGARVIACPLQPLTPSAYYPCVLLGRAGARLPVRVGHSLGLSMIWLPWRGALRHAARTPLREPVRDMMRHHVPFVYGISSAVFSRPKDWPEEHVLGGTWLSGDAGPPVGPGSATLRSFLSGEQAARTTVFVGFGSLEYLYVSLMEALAGAVLGLGWRAVIQTGRRPASSSQDLLYIEGQVPHDWVFRRVSAVVHHGGAGTFARAARAGVPSLAVAAAADGAFWAARGRALGVSPAPVRLSASEAELRRALRALVLPRLEMGAARLGAALRREQGPARGAGIIHDLVAGQGVAVTG